MAGERFKGGIGGAARRIRERKKIDKPSDDEIIRYGVFYLDRDLHFGNIDLIPTSENLFGNTNPVHVDVGCGRGEYVIEQAEQNPDKNFVGVDSHATSLYFGIQAVADRRLPNIRFIRADARNLFPHIPDETIQVCSVLFPAPILDRRETRELVCEPFVKEVHRVLSLNDLFVFVSDAGEYFRNRVSMINSLQLFRLNLMTNSIEDPSTRYQQIWQSKGIPSNRAEFSKID